jgi:DNA repair photolyase
MFYNDRMAPEQLFELRRRRFDTPQFRGIEFIEVEAKSIVNPVPGNYLPFNWTINPYRGCSHACTYCFARVTHTYMDMDAGKDFESKIVVKINAPELLRAKLRTKAWKGEHIAMGTATDPYQRAEGRYKLMPGIIQALTDHHNPFSILTKGTLMMRDLDLLLAAAEVTDVSTAFSIPTLDEDAWRKSEPGTPHPVKRMEAVARLNTAGIPSGVMLAPVLPGITDDLDGLRRVVEAATAAGATHVTPILLHLRPVVREEYMGWLQEQFPELVVDYEQLYRRSAYGPKDERNKLSRAVGTLLDEAGFKTKGVRRLRPRRSSPEKPGRESEQLTLL